MTRPIVIQTERFRLCELHPDDAAAMFELNADPEVLRFTGDPPFASVAEAREFLLAYDAYQRHGMGRWAVWSKEADELVGWCGLKFSPDLDEVDLGFRFFRRCWGKGIATETALATLEYGRATLGLKSIVGRAMIENVASHRVLEKIGMRRERVIEGTEWVQFIAD